ncbi:MAG: hypothetical protein Q6352_008365 [Candidatus Freyrarchaeum guaymaensis]
MSQSFDSKKYFVESCLARIRESVRKGYYDEAEETLQLLKNLLKGTGITLNPSQISEIIETYKLNIKHYLNKGAHTAAQNATKRMEKFKIEIEPFTEHKSTSK